MKTWDKFFLDVLPDVPGCPQPLVEHALRRAAQKFCSGSKIWKVWIDPITTIDGIVNYDLDLDSNSDVSWIENATLDGKEINPTTEQSLPANWMTSQAGISDCIFTLDGKSINLIPSAGAGRLLKVEVCLTPSNTSTGVEDFIYDAYVDIIATGAKARLMRLNKQEFTNFPLGKELDDSFTSSIASTAFQASRGFSRALPRARIKTF